MTWIRRTAVAAWLLLLAATPAKASGHQIESSNNLDTAWSILVANTHDTSDPPGPPRNLTATADGESIDLSWDPPSDSGSSAIAGYRVEVSFDGEDFFELESNTGSTATTFRDNVGPGSTRHYRVSAINEDDLTGPPSNVAHATTEGSEFRAPGPPRNLTATAAGIAAIDLSWDPPTDSGSSAITDYVIEVSSDGGQEWSVLAYTVAEVTTYRHSGLAPGSTRHYRVLAINGDSQLGPSSNVAHATTEGDDIRPPGPPRNLTAMATGQTVIDLSWDPPTDSGSSSMEDYRIEVSSDGGQEWSTLALTIVEVTTYRHSGLAPGSTRHYRVWASNEESEGPPSNVAHATTEGGDIRPPGPPRDLTATAAGYAAIDLSWDPPTDSGSSSMEDYRIEVSSDGGQEWSTLALTIVEVTTYRHSGLAPGSTRHYRVWASNEESEGPPSNVAHATTEQRQLVAPGPPTSLTATADGDSAIDLSWTAPADTGSSAIVGYRIEVSDDGGTNWSDLRDNTGSTATTFRHTGLEPVSTRHYRVSAINEAGAGEPSEVASASTAATTPGAPTGLIAASQGTDQVNLSWTAPAADGGAAVSGYRIEVSEDSAAIWTDLVANTGSTATQFAHTGLRPGTTRHYRVQAINEVGLSDPSNVAGATTDAIAPDPPTDLVATASGATRIELTWTAPAYDGGAPVTGYRIEVSEDASAWTDLERSTGTNATTYAHTGLRPEGTWHYRVSAINAAGTSVPSGIASVTIDDAVQRAGRVNRAVLPHFAAAAATSTLSAIAGRIETVAARRPTAGRLGGVGAWGGVEYHGMGEPEAADVRWEGDMLSAHVGMDLRVRPDVLLGVAGSQSTGNYDFADLTHAREIAGTYHADMVSVSPYVAWLPGVAGSAVWAAGGLGWGEVAVDDELAGRRASKTRMTTGALGARHRLLSSGFLWIGLRTEAWLSRVEVEGTEDMDALALEMRRARFLLEWTQVHRFETGHEMNFMLEGGLRYDIGDAVNGMGMELGGGFRYVSPSRTVTLEGRGRARLSGSSGYREWGVGGRVEITPQGGNRGLSLRLAPAWGEAASGVQELWERAVSDRPGGGGGPEGRLNAEMEYGLPAFPAVPYGRVQLAPGGSRTFGTGMRFEVTRVLDVRLEGSQIKNHANNASHRLAISGRWHF